MTQRPGGVGQYFCDGLLVKEVHESTCAHCQHITAIPDPKRLTDFVDVCRQCNALICLGCAGQPCAPWKKKIDEAEEKAARRAQFARAMGFES